MVITLIRKQLKFPPPIPAQFVLSQADYVFKLITFLSIFLLLSLSESTPFRLKKNKLEEDGCFVIRSRALTVPQSFDSMWHRSVLSIIPTVMF
jgi:hypothetical protein